MLNDYIRLPVYCNIMCVEATVSNESSRTVRALKSRKGLYIFSYCILFYCKVVHPDNTFVLVFDIFPWELNRRSVEAGGQEIRPGGRLLRAQAIWGVEEAGAKIDRISINE